jgi:phosphoribosyl 1,2-cyclic phosphate phosphodiesterase
VPDATFEAIAGVEFLITSALRHRPHPTHMSLEEALAVAERVGARKTWFTHMGHDLEHVATNAILPPGVELAYDGLSFEA